MSECTLLHRLILFAFGLGENVLLTLGAVVYLPSLCHFHREGRWGRWLPRTHRGVGRWGRCRTPDLPGRSRTPGTSPALPASAQEGQLVYILFGTRRGQTFKSLPINYRLIA